MQFDSLNFILKFLPIFLMIYYIVPQKFRNLTLFAGSLIFYAFAGYSNLPVFLLCVLVNYFLSRYLIRKHRFFLILSLFFNIGILIHCKATGHLIPGMSFLIFELVALSIDVYRHRTQVKSFTEYGVYTTLFAKVISGPIVKYNELKSVISKRSSSLENVERGLVTFLLGLGYKILLADRLASVWRGVTSIGIDAISTPMAWLSMFSYSLQLYYDFQGYSLMAIGIGEMLGFTLPENFDSPYCAKTVSQFYRRWHITLGRWFRDYTYIPLGGSRRGMAITIRNLIIVWLLTSLWHGFSLHYLLWGASICFLIIIEKIGIGIFLERSKVLSHLYLLLLIPMSWMLFVLPDISSIQMFFCKLFAPFIHFSDVTVNTADFMKYGQSNAVFLLFAVLFALPWPEKIIRRNGNNRFVILLLLCILWLSVWMLKSNLNNPFLYSLF